MHKMWLCCGLVLCLAGSGWAQEAPRVDVFGGASYFRVHASGAEGPEFVGVPGVLLCPPSVPSVIGCLEQRNVNFNLYGWNATATENLNKWFGGDLDVGGAYNSPNPNFFFPSVPIVTKLHTVMYGPRFSYRKSERITPFTHVLLGVAHITGHNNQATVFTPIPTVVPQGTSRTDTAFAWALGGGVDLKVNRRVAIRLIQADYVMTRFFDQRQDNGRLSAGIVIRFGGK